MLLQEAYYITLFVQRNVPIIPLRTALGKLHQNVPKKNIKNRREVRQAYIAMSLSNSFIFHICRYLDVSRLEAIVENKKNKLFHHGVIIISCHSSIKSTPIYIYISYQR